MLGKFLCYKVVNKNPEISKPIGWVIVGEGDLYMDENLDKLKQDISNQYPDVEFVDDCGWVLEEEEYSLMNLDNEDVLSFNLQRKITEPEYM